MMRGFFPLVVFGALMAAFGYGLLRDDPRVLNSALIDQAVPDFALPSLDNPDRLITQDVFLGQVSVLNVFGSWCTACTVEHPKLMDISARGEVQIIGVNWRDTRNKGKAWLARYGNPYTDVIFDDASLLAIELGITGAPESYIIDSAGRIRFKHTGIITDAIWAKDMRPVIQGLRAEAGL